MHRAFVVLAAAAILALAAPPAADRFRAAQRRYWVFQPVVKSAVPAGAAWGTNPIDAFAGAKLAEKGIKPSAEADKVTLLRRVYFDLTGLPPEPRDVDAFLADQSATAYESVVDRLLASPGYGERWARHWLDLARYAESDGFRADDIRANAWRYRDYVIRSFNADKPYNRFVEEQIAGDEMWPADLEAKVATAFNRHYPDEYNAQNLRARRQEILNDITDTVGSVFLGLTFECARCHDHKFDPILQADYYRLQAFFSNISADDEFPMLSPEAHAAYQKKLAAWESKTADIRARMSAVVKAARDRQVKSRYTAYVEEVKKSLDKPADERTPMELWMADKAKYFMNPAEETLAAGLKGEAKATYKRLKAELDQFRNLHPGPLPKGTGITELTGEPIPAHVLSVGVYDKPLEKVEPGFLTILDPEPAVIVPPANGKSTGRRTALAKWLTDPANPITARVMVNRIWHYHFGRGIVGSPSDFGMMGERPTHPELLDWLAAEFVQSGWSMKHMHRLIMTSRTYRQSSAHRPDAAEKDPSNRLLWRYERRRLEAESIRDTSLAVSGLLDRELCGPSVRPGAGSHHRRSIYTFLRRNSLYPILEAFDLPDTHLSCGRRSATTTAPQALTYLNSEQGMEWARGFAGRVLEQAGPDRGKQVETAYRLAYSRSPGGKEKDIALSFFAQHESIVAGRAAAGGKLAAPENLPASVSRVEAAALVDFCHALMNSSEFVYVN
ncbi:MAG: DUF1549 and DUF1553 domain-containing protein [Bryobacteraceae bacterium]|nr:DUF1549 and DUF1553 domain-containing protein [Bryobacteraceae bacterium]